MVVNYMVFRLSAIDRRIRLSAARALVPDFYKPLLARRMQRPGRQAHEIFRLEETGNGDFFVDRFPVNTDAPTNEFPTIPLLTSGRE